MRRDVVGEPDIAANHGAFPDANAAKDGSVGINCHSVFKHRVAGLVHGTAVFIVPKILGSKRNALI